MKVSKNLFALGCILFLSFFSLDSIGALWNITPEIDNPQVTIAPDGNVLITWLEHDEQLSVQ